MLEEVANSPFFPLRMALDEREEVREHLEDIDEGQDSNLDDRRMQVCQLPLLAGLQQLTPRSPLQQYANLFFLLQSEPRHIASLCRLVSLSEIDTLLQTVMFTLYGNQYESREEHLLLTMFQACPRPTGVGAQANPSIRAVRSLRPIRDRHRVRIPASRQHARLADDDDLHATRTWSELPQERTGREDQQSDRAQGSQPRDQPSQGAFATEVIGRALADGSPANRSTSR